MFQNRSKQDTKTANVLPTVTINKDIDGPNIRSPAIQLCANGVVYANKWFLPAVCNIQDAPSPMYFFSTFLIDLENIFYCSFIFIYLYVIYLSINVIYLSIFLFVYIFIYLFYIYQNLRDVHLMTILYFLIIIFILYLIV